MHSNQSNNVAKNLALAVAVAHLDMFPALIEPLGQCADPLLVGGTKRRRREADLLMGRIEFFNNTTYKCNIVGRRCHKNKLSYN